MSYFVFQEGTWNYDISNPGNRGACNARLRIEGFPDTSSPNDEEQPILMSAQANKVIVDVQRGKYFLNIQLANLFEPDNNK